MAEKTLVHGSVIVTDEDMSRFTTPDAISKLLAAKALSLRNAMAAALADQGYEVAENTKDWGCL